MRLRTVALALLTVVTLAATVSVTPAQGRQVADWAPLSSSWPGVQRVSVSDITSFGRFGYAVATTTNKAGSTPWVQTCSLRKCKATRLPRPGGRSTTVTSISGSERTDIWAVGYTTTGIKHRPVWWHKVGKTWSLVNTGIGGGPANIRLTQVEVSNKSKAFATGRYMHNEATRATTSTLYRWNGNGWKEVGPVGEIPSVVFAGTPCDGWYKRSWTDVIARTGSAVLIGKCGAHKKPVVLEQGDTSWTLMEGHGLPADFNWREGALIGQQVWLVGSRNGRTFMYANDDGNWSRVPTQGLRANAVVADLAGVFASKVTAVGWIATGGGHRIATAWRWGAGAWHPTDVPAGVSRSTLTAASIEGDGPVFASGNDLGRKPHLRALIFRSRG